jgi:hypothetical protein
MVPTNPSLHLPPPPCKMLQSQEDPMLSSRESLDLSAKELAVLREKRPDHDLEINDD